MSLTSTVQPTRTRQSTARPVPRWARHAAELAALAPVASSLWRLPLMFGISMGMDAEMKADMMSHPFWQRLGYLGTLGILTDGLAFLTLGLVRGWGEIWPRWIPVLRGRAMPPAVALAPAIIGGITATVLFTYMAFIWNGNMEFGYTGWAILQTCCYAPLVLWGPLVLLVTAHYYRRRTAGRGERRPETETPNR
jgi:hypothetical protein